MSLPIEGVAAPRPKQLTSHITDHRPPPEPARQVPAVGEYEGIFVFLLARDQPASSAITQDLLGWKPTHPGLIEDIEQGQYFT